MGVIRETGARRGDETSGARCEGTPTRFSFLVWFPFYFDLCLSRALYFFSSQGSGRRFVGLAKARSPVYVRMASHELFQMTTEAKAVVVLMKNTKSNPTARMLAAVLRDQKS